MVKSYVIYGIYDEDTCQCLEKGDSTSRLTFWKDGKKITVSDVEIVKISKDKIMFETKDLKRIEIAIEDIEDWD